MTRHENPKLPAEALEAFAGLVAAMRLEGMTDRAILDQLKVRGQSLDFKIWDGTERVVAVTGCRDV